MSRQFRSDDTNKWVNGFGNGSAGNLTFGGGTLSGSQGYYVTTITGNSGATTARLGASWSGRHVCFIHQTQKNSGAGVWELNILNNTSSSTTGTFEYPLQNTYTSGAQIVLANQYNNITLSGATTVNGWNGSTGGILFLYAAGTLTLNGTLSVAGLGFRGGTNPGYNNQTGYTGEGHTGGMLTNTNSNQGNGGGGGAGKTGGAGGGNGEAGGYGEYEDGRATPGTAAGNANLTTMVFGGAGGSGHDTNTSQGITRGGNGGGIVVLIARSIVINGTLSANGNYGVNEAGYWGGAGGAGGSVLLKANSLTLGSNKVTASGGAASQRGGSGGVGRIAADYSGSISGSTSPTIVTRRDTYVQPMPYVTVNSGAGGSISPGSGQVNYGVAKTYTVTAAEGYTIASISVGGVKQTITSKRQQSITITPTADVIIAATFVADVQVDVDVTGKGSVMPSSSKVNYGQSTNYTITPQKGWVIKSISINGATQTVDNKKGMTIAVTPTSATTISVVFKPSTNYGETLLVFIN